ncbi:IS110 family RNA-guided transposase [Kitasatospora purpeofusca]|uniref:IS110 family transposase n=1 Tax=Kitasatospora purpeofusca TaxID=67352 RepID=UPI0037F21D79
MATYTAGIDWSTLQNDLAVVDRHGRTIANARFEATPAGIKAVLQTLAGLRNGHSHSRRAVPIAIEAANGLLVSALRHHGQTVVPIAPSTVARYRGRLNPGHTKSDRGDASLLANILRTDGAAHRPLHSNSDLADAIGILTRTHLRTQRTRHYLNLQLRSRLRAVHPAALTAWAALPNNLLRPEARQVLALAPTSRGAARLRKYAIRAALERGGRFRLLDAEAERLHSLFQEPVLLNTPAVEDALGIDVRTTVGLLDETCTALDALAEEIDARFLEHPQCGIYLSMPGVGPLTGARLLGEIGDDPGRFATGKGLAAYAGARPFTWESGSSRTVLHRRVAANKHLAAYCHRWAFATLTQSSECRAHYDRRREGGERHNAALRNLSARLLSCLHHCLSTGQPYDPAAAWPDRETAT